MLNGCRVSALKNSALMSVTCETFQRWMGPYLVSGQCPFASWPRHSDTAFFSTSLDFGENVFMESGERFVPNCGESAVPEILPACPASIFGECSKVCTGVRAAVGFSTAVNVKRERFVMSLLINYFVNKLTTE